MAYRSSILTVASPRSAFGVDVYGTESHIVENKVTGLENDIKRGQVINTMERIWIYGFIFHIFKVAS